MLYANSMRNTHPVLFKRLLIMSFEHNLKNSTPFPFKALFELQTVSTLHSDKLNQFIELVLKKVGESQELIHNQHAILCVEQAISQLSLFLQQHPTAISLAATLLKQHHQNGTTDWQAYHHCLQSISTYIRTLKQSENCSSILEHISFANDDEPLSKLRSITFTLLSVSDDQLAAIKVLFEYQPYPNTAQLCDALNHLGSLDAWMHQFDRDPFGRRKDNNALQKQFDTTQIKRVINFISHNREIC